MPTGYTAGVADGTVTDFREFAMTCARAFGALVELRDSPGAEIPEEFTPSPYHTEKLQAARDKLANLTRMSPEEIEAASMAHNKAAFERHLEVVAHDRETRERYEGMLAQVRAWTPPTPEHTGLRDFMVEQLTESVRFDTDTRREPPKELTATEWHEQQIAKASRDIRYHTRQRDNERERAAERTEWVRALRDSLPRKHAGAATDD